MRLLNMIKINKIDVKLNFPKVAFFIFPIKRPIIAFVEGLLRHCLSFLSGGRR